MVDWSTALSEPQTLRAQGLFLAEGPSRARAHPRRRRRWTGRHCRRARRAGRRASARPRGATARSPDDSRRPRRWRRSRASTSIGACWRSVRRPPTARRPERDRGGDGRLRTAAPADVGEPAHDPWGATPTATRSPGPGDRRGRAPRRRGQRRQLLSQCARIRGGVCAARRSLSGSALSQGGADVAGPRAGGAVGAGTDGGDSRRAPRAWHPGHRSHAASGPRTPGLAPPSATCSTVATLACRWPLSLATRAKG